MMRQLLILLLLPILAAPLAARAEEPPKGPIPYPWEASVRLHNELPGIVAHGSGTVVHSTADRAIVLTCAHLFADKFLDGRVTVDVFHGEMKMLLGQGRLKYRESFPGKRIAVAPKDDVALVEFSPGRIVAASPVAATAAPVAVGSPLTSVGCPLGADATVWSTVALGSGAFENGYRYTECKHPPTEGRSGGGLFDLQGRVVGVCDFRTDAPSGLYAAPESIRSILSANGLACSYTATQWPPACRPGTPCYPSPQSPAPPAPAYRPRPRPNPPPPPVVPTAPVPGPDPPATILSAPDATPWSLGRIEASLPEWAHLAAAAGAAIVLVPSRRPRTAPGPERLAA